MPITEQEPQEPGEAFVAHYGGGQFSFFPDDETTLWSERDIRTLRCELLEETIRQALDGRESVPSRLEALNWLLDDSEGAFSVTTCCAEGGLNVMALRELIIPEVDKAIMDARKRLVVSRRRSDYGQETLWHEPKNHESAVCA